MRRISNSNETEYSGRITKRGTKLGRTILIQCALIALIVGSLDFQFNPGAFQTQEAAVDVRMFE